MAQFRKDEPVLAVTGAFVVVNYVMSYLVLHGIITGAQASVNTQMLVPIVAAVMTAIAGIAARSLVTPAKKVEAALQKHFGVSLDDLKESVGVLAPNVAADVKTVLHTVVTGLEDKISDSVSVPEEKSADGIADSVEIPEETI